MIDLSSAKVGDKFVDSNRNIVEIMIADNGCDRYVAKGLGVTGGKVFYVVYDNDGVNLNDDCCDIIAKHDPRPWLKDLPNADLFEDDIYLYCSASNQWSFGGQSTSLCSEQTYFMGARTILSGIKMPNLTGDQWKDSKISIDELRDWQEANP